MYIVAGKCTRIRGCTCICLRIGIFVCVCVLVRVCVGACMRVHIHKSSHATTHTHTYTHTHTFTYATITTVREFVMAVWMLLKLLRLSLNGLQYSSRKGCVCTYIYTYKI